MSTPIERGAEVLWGNAFLPDDLRPLYQDKARAVFESIDVEGLALALARADGSISDDPWPWGYLATAVRDYLLGGE